MLTVKFEKQGDESTIVRRKVLHNKELIVDDEIRLPVHLFTIGNDSKRGLLSELSSEDLVDVGGEIAECALGSVGLEKLQGLRYAQDIVHIRIEEPQELPCVAAVPWELMHDGHDYLAMHPKVYMSRIPDNIRPVDTITLKKRLRLLIVWSQPVDLSPLAIEREYMHLSMALAPHLNSPKIEHREIVHCTKEKLKKALRTGYDIVYLTGHGGVDLKKGGFLCLEKKRDHTSDPLYARELARYIAVSEHPPALVFLNCCLSGGVMAENGHVCFQDTARSVMGEKVPFVVATLTPVLIPGAQHFMAAFMEAILSGDKFDVPRAVSEGRAALHDCDSLSLVERQSFYQYMLLSACRKGWERDICDDSLSKPGDVAPVLYTSAEFPGEDIGRVRRIDMLADIEESMLEGSRLLGVYGVGGLGKTVLSAQWLAYLGRHTQFDVKYRFWFDLRVNNAASNSLYEHFIGQIRGVLRMHGELQLEQTISQEVNLDPAVLAQKLRRVFGFECACVIDNCEVLLECNGSDETNSLMKYVHALVIATGWQFLFTSREKFSFEREGRNPHPILWCEMGELLPTERAHLLSLAKGRGDFDFASLGENGQLIIFNEIAGHPYELNLFLKEANRREDLRELISDVHEKTGQYARLDYYLECHPESHREILRLLSLLDKSIDMRTLSLIWTNAQLRNLVPLEELSLGQIVAELMKCALLQDNMGLYNILPVLRCHLINGKSKFRMSLVAQNTWNIFLANLFNEMSCTLKRSSIDLLKQDVIKDDSFFSQLNFDRVDFLHRSFLHAFRSDNITLYSLLLQTLSNEASGLLSNHVLNEYACKLISRVDDIGDEKDLILPAHVGARIVAAGVFAELRLFCEAIKSCEKCLRIGHLIGDESQTGYIYHMMGRIYEEQREYEKAEYYYLSSIQWKERMGLISDIGLTYHQLGSVCLNKPQPDFDSAKKYYLLAIEMHEKHGLLNAIGLGYHQLGQVALKEGEFSIAEKHYFNAIKWNTDADKMDLLGMSYHQLGMMHHFLEKYIEAEKFYRQAINWKEKTGAIDRLASSYHQLGALFQDQEKWDEAEEYYRSSVKIKEQLNQLHLLSATYHQLGRCFVLQSRWNEAEENFYIAVKYAKRTAQLHELGVNYHMLGCVFENREQWDEAESYYNKAILWYKKTNLYSDLGVTYNQLGIVCAGRHEWKRAGDYYLHSLNSFLQNNGSLSQIKGILRNCMEVLQKTDHLELAILVNGIVGSGIGFEL